MANRQLRDPKLPRPDECGKTPPLPGVRNSSEGLVLGLA